MGRRLGVRVLAVVLIALALVVGVVPQFTNCHYDGKFLTLENGRQVDMKCYWTARASIATAVPLFAVGGLMLAARRRETVRSLAGSAGLMGLFAALLPTALIGVCTNMTASCNQIMKPTLLLAGILVVGVAVGATVLSARGPGETA